MGLTSITHKHLLICEGMHDVQFFNYFAQARQLPSFQATSSGYIAGAQNNRDGIDWLTPALDALPSIGPPSFFKILQKILIIADNDSSPVGKFQTIQQYINNTAEIQPSVRYVAPLAEQVAAGVNPSITVLMLPWTGQTGALDTLCLAAARNKRPAMASCVDAFTTCVAPVGWLPPREDKMKLRTLMSAAYADPYISPAWVWRDGTDLVPLDDPVFTRVENFLRAFLI